MNSDRVCSDPSDPRQALGREAGRRFWRSLAELEDGQTELAPREEALLDPWSRRKFMKLMAASLALAGTPACSRKPLEKIVPYVRGPAQSEYGKAVFFASAHVRNGYGNGVLVATRMGRPTKIEGNPLHPASLGATDIFAQASVLDLWDPERSATVRRGAELSTWLAFLAALAEQMRDVARRQGAGLRILTETVTSPSLAAHAIARRLGVAPGETPALPWASQWIEAAARDLMANRGASAVVVGDAQPAHVHALAHAMNDALGNAGVAVLHTPPVAAEPSD